MLLLSAKFIDTPVMSLQTGAEIARTTEAIIDPGVLEIVAFRLDGSRLDSETALLLTRDIRESGSIGFIVDSSDELVDEADILKIQQITKLKFGLIDMDVIDEKKHKLGKIYDYTLDPTTFTIHQLYVKRPLLKSFQTSDLIVSRKQIVEINNKSVVVKAATINARPEPAAGAPFTNPFKKASNPSQNAVDQQ